MAGQDFSPHTEGSSGHGAARLAHSSQNAAICRAGDPARPYLPRFWRRPFFTRETVTGSVFGTPATVSGRK